MRKNLAVRLSARSLSKISRQDGLNIGRPGRDRLGDVLDKPAEHEQVNGHRILVARSHDAAAARAFPVLFISSSERTRPSHLPASRRLVQIVSPEEEES